jgi:hypothetical protein
LTLWLNSSRTAISNMTIEVNDTSFTRAPVIEILAIGGDGKEISCGFVLHTEGPK